MVEFTDRASVEAWLRHRPMREVAAFASLNAADAFPAVVLDADWQKTNLDLHCARSILTAYITVYFGPEISEFKTNEFSELSTDSMIGISDTDPSGVFGISFSRAATAAFATSAILADAVIEDYAINETSDIEMAADAAVTSAIVLGGFDRASRHVTNISVFGAVEALLGSLRPFAMDSVTETSWSTLYDIRSKNLKVWGFWIDWYEGLLEGRAPDWALWREVALIPNDVWEAGPEAVALAIEGVKARLVKVDPIADAVDASLATTSMPATKEIEAVQSYITKHRADLPPTFDAIEEYIALEIERLQKDNYLNSHEPEYVRRAIETLLTLHEAITALRVTIPAAGPISTEVAERSIRLFAVYKDKFKKLPIEKADEVVEGVWQTSVGSARVGLIFASTALGGYLGIPPHLAFAGGAMAFAPKQASDLIKAAKEAFTKST